MNNEEQIKGNSEWTDSDVRRENDLANATHSASSRIKVSDDSNSNEILVFTSHHNVYKVQKKEIRDKFQALQKIEFEPEEKPIYLTGEKHYKGFLIVAFENGKVGKITMESFKTDYNRKKLKNAFNSESGLIFIELIEHDIDLLTLSSIKKVVLFNTAHINPVESRTTKGVQVMKPKVGSSMIKVKRPEHAKLVDPEYYRKSEGLNVVGYYLKPGDAFERT
jgi:DNA gyrase subunit A